MGGARDERQPSNRRRRRQGPISNAPISLRLKSAALIAPVVAFFAPVFFFGRTLYLRDTGLYFYPHKVLIAQALRAGRLPQWDPQQFLGLPLLADPNFNVFHPLSLLCLLPEPWGFQLFVASCALFAAWGGYLLARQLDSSERGALVAALCFAWSGPFVSLVEGGQLVSAAFLPWLCAAAAALAKQPSPRRVAALAAAAALIFLSGTPEVGACAFLIAAVLAWPGGFRVRLFFAAACLLGAAIAAVQLLPTAAWLRESSRAGGFDFAQATAGSMHPWRLLGLIAPRFTFAQDAPGTPTWLGPLPYLEDVYLGAVPLLLALFARPRRALLALGALFLLLALGAHSPLYRALWAWLPPLRSVRFPEKFVLPVALIAALHAGKGWDALRERGSAAARVGALICAGLALGVFALRLLPWASLDELRAASLRGTALLSLPAELGFAALALLAIARKKHLALAALLTVDLGLAAAHLDFTVPAEELTRASPLAELISRDAAAPPWSYRVDVQPLGLGVEDVAQAGEPGWPRSRSIFWLRHRALFDSGAELTGLHFARGYSGFTSGGARAVFQSGRASLDLLAVRYGVEFGSPAHRSVYQALGFERLASGDASGFLRLWKNPRAFPRLRMVEQGAGPVRSTARILRFEPERIEAELDAAAPAQAVLADTMAQGWTATLDGAFTPALTAAGGLRAVAVLPGHHLLVWRYRAPGLLAGAWVSLCGLCTLFALGLRREQQAQCQPPVLLSKHALGEG